MRNCKRCPLGFTQRNTPSAGRLADSSRPPTACADPRRAMEATTARSADDDLRVERPGRVPGRRPERRRRSGDSTPPARREAGRGPRGARGTKQAQDRSCRDRRPENEGETMNAAQFRRICVIAAALCALAVPGVARADAVTDWNDYAANALVAARQSPTP